MSDAPASEVVVSSDQLVAYFRQAGKPAAAWRVGVEQEKIPVREDGRPVPYEGPLGIERLLTLLVEERGFVAEREDGHILALSRGAERITIEPGGQLELSGPALASAVASRDVLLAHVREVQTLGSRLGIRFISGGFHPFCSLDDVPWLPKRRYVVMRDYLPRRGALGRDMMKRTCTVQANLDYSDEANSLHKLRTALAIASVVTAMFASSPISDGRPNGYKSYRAAVWLETDEQRCGILPFAFRPGFCFKDYVEWALDVPMFFVVRDGAYLSADGISFRRFLEHGWQGKPATLADWEVHLSTLFPEARLKRYIEVRGADSAPLPFANGLAALWRGVLDDPSSCQAAFVLTADWSDAERNRVRRDVPRQGLATCVAGRSLAELAVELCRIAHSGLARLPEGVADRALLEPLADYAARGRCPADDMLADFEAAAGDPRQLVSRWELQS